MESSGMHFGLPFVKHEEISACTDGTETICMEETDSGKLRQIC